jgi:hypothetical protein
MCEKAVSASRWALRQQQSAATFAIAALPIFADDRGVGRQERKAKAEPELRSAARRAILSSPIP